MNTKHQDFSKNKYSFKSFSEEKKTELESALF